MKNERKIGSHVSVAGGLLGAAKEAASYDANTLMLYTGAPQNTVRKPISSLKVEEGLAFMQENHISDIVVHAPYIVNIASYDDAKLEFAKSFLKKELKTARAFESEYFVLHPGSFTGADEKYGIDRAAEVLNVLLEYENAPVICLETMAGKGSELCRTFEGAQGIIEKVGRKDKIGVCLDTCHVHDAGYDIVNSLDDVLQTFDDIVGLDKIKVIHLNGSLNPLGAKKDRHANLGAGGDNPRGEDKIGFDAIARVFCHPRLDGKIFILETPWLDDKTNLYKEEIAALRKVFENER